MSDTRPGDLGTITLTVGVALGITVVVLTVGFGIATSYDNPPAAWPKVVKEILTFFSAALATAGTICAAYYAAHALKFATKQGESATQAVQVNSTHTEALLEQLLTDSSARNVFETDYLKRMAEGTDRTERLLSSLLEDVDARRTFERAVSDELAQRSNRRKDYEEGICKAIERMEAGMKASRAYELLYQYNQSDNCQVRAAIGSFKPHLNPQAFLEKVESDDDLRMKIFSLCGWFEDIAIGVRSEHVNEDALYSSLKFVVPYYFNNLEKWIVDLRTSDHREDLYDNFAWLARRWANRDQEERTRRLAIL